MDSLRIGGLHANIDANQRMSSRSEEGPDEKGLEIDDTQRKTGDRV